MQVSSAVRLAFALQVLVSAAVCADPKPEQLPPPRVQVQAAATAYAPNFRRFNAYDYAATALVSAGYYVVEFTQKVPTSADWTGTLPLDNAARNLVVSDTKAGRQLAVKWSDRLWYSSVAYPVFDAFVTPAIRTHGVEVSWDMTLMNFQSFMLVSLLIRMPHKWIGRLRPDSIGCADDPNYSNHCGNQGLFASFPGGHLAVSMTGAGLSCAHHIHGELYGSRLADGLACGAALTAATTVGYLRMHADRHWLSDQLTGAAAGVFSGYVVPTIFYYHPFWQRKKPRAAQADARRPRARIAVLPWLDPQTVGAALTIVD